MIKGQMSLFDFMEEDVKPPIFRNKDILKNIKGLAEISDELPKYLVTFKKPVFMGYKKKICIYVGYWHSLDGWNYDHKEVKEWQEVKYKKGDEYHFYE